MEETRHGAGQSLSFELPNVGGGPDQYTAADLDSGSGVVLIVLLRNHYCPLSRRKVRALGDRIEAFEEARVTVAAVLPDTVDRAEVWARRYQPPFPLLADPAPAEEDGKRNDFDAFGTVQEWMPQRPGVVLVRTAGEDPTVQQIYSGASPQDCPSVGRMLDVATDARDAEPTPPN